MPPKVWEAWKYLKNPSINEVVRGGYMAMKNANGRPPKADVVAKIEKCNNVLDRYLDPFVKEDCSHNERYRNVESAISGLKGISEKATEFERLRTAEGRQGSELRNKPLSREQQAEVDARATELGQALYNEQNGIQTEAPQTDTSVDNVPSQTDSEAPTEGSAPQVDTAPTEVNTAEGEQTGEAQENGNTDNAPAENGETDNLSPKKKVENFLRQFVGQNITNKATGIVANFGTTGVKKMLSNKAVEKSVNNGFTQEQHLEAARNIVSLFENATLSEEQADKNNSPEIKAIGRFRCDTTVNGEKAIAKITVKETVQHGNKIYSVELEALEKPVDDNENTRNSQSTGSRDSADKGNQPSTSSSAESPTSNSSVAEDGENGKQILDGDTAKVITDNGSPEQTKTDIANAKELNRRLKLDEEGQKAYDFLYKKFKNSKHIDMDDNIVQALAKMVAFHAQSMGSVQRAYGLENYSALDYAKRLEIEFSGRGAKSSKRGTNQEEYNRAAQRIINKILIRKIAPDETQYDKARTVLHEFGHYFLSDLYNITHSPRGKCPAQLKEDYGKLVEWLGGDKHHPIDEMWRSRKYNEEKLARAFEKYFAEGKAPTEELQSAFDKIIGGLKKALEKIKVMLEEYTGTSWAKKYAYHEIPAEIQEAMDRMFTYDATGADMASITYEITSDRVGRTTYRYNEENRPTEKSIDRSERNVDNGEKGFTPITNRGEYEKSKSAIAKSMWGTDGYYFPERQRAEMFADVRYDIGSDELQKKLESARGQEDIDRIREQSPTIRRLNVAFNKAKGKEHCAVELQYAREVFEHDPRIIQARTSTNVLYNDELNGQGRVDTSTELLVGDTANGRGNQSNVGRESAKSEQTSKNASTGGIVVAGEYDASAQLYDKLYNEHKLKHPKLAEKDLQDSSAFSNGKNSRSAENRLPNPNSASTLKQDGNTETALDKLPKIPREKLRESERKIQDFGNQIGVPVHFVEHSDKGYRGQFRGVSNHNGEIYINRSASVPAKGQAPERSIVTS